jgi:eukaryotic-like serine/threonine-protein kinase
VLCQLSYTHRAGLEHTHCPEDRNALPSPNTCPTVTPALSTMTVLANLGRGAVFEVDLVSDSSGTVLVRKRIAQLNRKVPEAETALQREMRILQRMGGDHLPRLAGAGTDDRGPFLLQTRAKGRSLRDLSVNTADALDAKRWLDLAVSAALALAELHDRADSGGCLQFVHGDISPDNVFWDESGTVTLIDLSNATFREGPIPAFPRARGSLPYVAPEIARNENAGDTASDTYAMAATLLTLAIGPIVQNTTEAARLIEVGSRGLASSRLECREDIPRGAREALTLALRFDRTERITSSRELLRRLSSVAGR